MEEQQFKSKVITSLFWKLMERGGTQGIQFIVQIILARLLLPEEFGTIALLMIFIFLANVFVQSGFSTALIQKRDSNETDFSSVFYLSLVVAGLIYFVLFFSAPLIAEFYEDLTLVLLLRVLSITLFFGAINSIQIAVVARNLEFRKLFYSSLGAVVVSGVIGITMAYNGYGTWALVAQQLSDQCLVTVILWFTVNWRPKLLFSIKSTGELFSFGWKLLVSALINTFCTNSQSLIIGKIYSPAMLGYFNRGLQFPSIIVTNINGSIQSVMLPALSAQQDNKLTVKRMVRRAIVTSSFLVFPLMVGLAVVAEPLVIVLLTEKWLPCVPFLKVFCAVFALIPIHTANLQAINALGRSDIFLKLEILKNMIGLAILGVTVFYGVYTIAIGMLINGFIALFINAYPNLKLLDYSYQQQLRDVLPALLLSLVMGAIVYCFSWLRLNPIILLAIQVCAGMLLYFGMAKLFKLESFSYLLTTVKMMFDKPE